MPTYVLHAHVEIERSCGYWRHSERKLIQLCCSYFDKAKLRPIEYGKFTK
jgi:hypothetical protein